MVATAPHAQYGRKPIEAEAGSAADHRDLLVGLRIEETRDQFWLHANALGDYRGDRHDAIRVRQLGERLVERKQSLSLSLKDRGGALVVLRRRHRSRPPISRTWKILMREIR